MLRIVCRAADAVDVGFMQGVDLVSALGLLVQQLGYQGKFDDDPIPQASLWDVIQLTAQVGH